MKTFSTEVSGMIVNDVEAKVSESGVYFAFFKMAIELSGGAMQLLKVVCYEKVVESAKKLKKGQSVENLQGYLKPKSIKTTDDDDKEVLILEFVCTSITSKEEQHNNDDGFPDE